MALTHHTGIPRPLNAGCSPRVIISVSNNPFCLGSSVTFTPTITCLETANIASYAWVVNGTIVSASGDPYVTTELTNNDSVYLLVIGTNGISYFSNVIYMVVTSEGCITDIKYGLLYNWYAATDSRNIAASGWHVPSESDFTTLTTYLSTNVGGKLKETGTTYWDSPNTGATNEVGFNARGVGYRNDLGSFADFKIQMWIWNTESIYSTGGAGYLNTNFSYFEWSIGAGIYKTYGNSIRLVKDDSNYVPTYTGTDGKVYSCVQVGTQIWLAENLAETKFRNGDYLHGYEGGSYQAISNAAWSALVSEGVCCYNDDINLI